MALFIKACSGIKLIVSYHVLLSKHPNALPKCALAFHPQTESLNNNHMAQLGGLYLSLD